MSGVLEVCQVCWRCVTGVLEVCHKFAGGVEVLAQDQQSEQSIIPAQNFEPSTMLAVSLKGLSVPLTSWWSLLSAMGPYRKQQMDTVMPTSLPTASDVVQLEALPQTHCNIARIVSPHSLNLEATELIPHKEIFKVSYCQNT